MVTISINAAAFAAIEATLPNGSKAEDRPDGKSGYRCGPAGSIASSARRPKFH
jgi:hypothetical protein